MESSNEAEDVSESTGRVRDYCLRYEDFDTASLSDDATNVATLSSPCSTPSSLTPCSSTSDEIRAGDTDRLPDGPVPLNLSSKKMGRRVRLSRDTCHANSKKRHQVARVSSPPASNASDKSGE